MNLVNKLLVTKSIMSGRDLVYEFATLCLDALTTIYSETGSLSLETTPVGVKSHDLRRLASFKEAPTDLQSVTCVIQFLNAGLRRVRNVRSSQILLFQSRSLAN